MKHIASLLIAVALSCSVSAQQNGWRDRSGKPIPDTEARKSKDDFAGWLVVTSDTDWAEKWATPSHVVPEFKEARTLTRNQKAFVLIFFSNPKLSVEGRADVLCDLRVTRPDGSNSIDQRDAVCFQGVISGAPTNLYLSAPVIGFVGEPADPIGTWVITVNLKDRLRGTALPLKSSFTLQ